MTPLRPMPQRATIFTRAHRRAATQRNAPAAVQVSGDVPARVRISSGRRTHSRRRISVCECSRQICRRLLEGSDANPFPIAQTPAKANAGPAPRTQPATQKPLEALPCPTVRAAPPVASSAAKFRRPRQGPLHYRTSGKQTPPAANRSWDSRRRNPLYCPCRGSASPYLIPARRRK